MVRCLCIDDKNKPAEINPARWIKEGKEYNIIHIYFQTVQKVQGVLLEEVAMTDEDAPYKLYMMKRFAIHEDDLDKFLALLKECNDLNDVPEGMLEDLMADISKYETVDI